MNKYMRPVLVLAALATASVAPAFADVIVDGDFENGFTGWTVVGGATGVSLGQDGTNVAYLGTVGYIGTVSQTFTDVAGDTYALSFNLYNPDSNGPSYFGAQVDSTLLFSLGNAATGTPAVAGPFDNEYTVDFVGTGSDTLTFLERRDPSYFQLDNVTTDDLGVVSTSATPEPSSLVLLGTGILSAAGAARRKFRKA